MLLLAFFKRIHDTMASDADARCLLAAAALHPLIVSYLTVLRESSRGRFTLDWMAFRWFASPIDRYKCTLSTLSHDAGH